MKFKKGDLVYEIYQNVIDKNSLYLITNTNKDEVAFMILARYTIYQGTTYGTRFVLATDIFREE